VMKKRYGKKDYWNTPYPARVIDNWIERCKEKYKAGPMDIQWGYSAGVAVTNPKRAVVLSG
jgi:hypothetical protein